MEVPHEAIVGLGAAGAAMLAWIASGTKTMRRAVAWGRVALSGAERVLARLDTIERKVEAIRAEVSPNGGQSTKDLIVQIRDMATLAAVRAEAALDLQPIGIWHTDVAGNNTYANRALCELFGLSADEMRGAGWLRAVHDDQRDAVWRRWADSIARGYPFQADFTVVNQRTGMRYRVRSQSRGKMEIGGKTPTIIHGTVEKVYGDGSAAIHVEGHDGHETH